MSESKVERMLSFLLDALGAGAPEEEIVAALLPAYKAAVYAHGRKIMEDYINEHMGDFGEVAAVPVVAEKHEAQDAQVIKQAPGKRKYTRRTPTLSSSLQGYNIDMGKYKYIPIREHGWLSKFTLPHEGNLALARYMLVISEELDLGYFKKEINGPKGTHYRVNFYPAPVYAEMKRRFEAGELPNDLQKMLTNALTKAEETCTAPMAKGVSPTPTSFANACEALVHNMGKSFPNAKVLSRPA